MKIVIDIPEGDYEELVQTGENTIHLGLLLGLRECIRNGTILPKGHGRLIDADESIKTLKSLGNRDYRREKGTIQEAVKMLSSDEYTPTIIEADKEE